MAATTKPAQTKPVEMPPPAPVTNLPAARPRATVNAIVPATWQEVTAIASAICRAGMAPKSYCKTDGYGKLIYADGKPIPEPEKVAIGIMHGMEVGMTPMASLQSIAVINGMPSLWGDGLVAVVRASGELEDLQEGLEVDDKDGKPLLAWCKVKRRGEVSWKERQLTWPEVIRAGWAKKEGPWTNTPGRMMIIRVRGWLLRDMFADVLRGLHSAEESEDMVDITPQVNAAPAPTPDEPKRADYTEPKPEPSASGTSPAAAGSGQPEEKAAAAPTAASGQPVSGKPPYDATASETASRIEQAAAAGQVYEPAKPTRVKGDVTDVEDESEKAEPALVFEDYKRPGDWFQFADNWLQDTSRTVAELTAFSSFYYEYMMKGLAHPKLANDFRETKKFLDDAITAAEQRAKAAPPREREPGEEG
jgi:hypothetical protein